MPHRRNFVPETSPVNEDEFRDAMIAGLARAQRSVGARALAYIMDVTTKQLGNIFAGSSTNAKRLWDALAADPTALDDIASAYGRKIVAADSVTDAEIGTLPIAALLAKVAEAESPDSPGGVAKTHKELLAMEADIRAVHHLTGNWIERISSIRAPRAVA